MTTRTIKSPEQIPALVSLLSNRKLPVTVTIVDGANRTTRQNRLQFDWFKQIAEQLGDHTPQEIRALCKLEIGVPILRQENEAFRLTYDRLIKDLPYSDKLELMERMDIPVTRLMTTKQHTAFLDAVFKRFTQQGVQMTLPEGQ